MPIQDALKDYDRIRYFQGATDALVKAIHEDGVDIRSYFPWSKVFSFFLWLPLLLMTPCFY